MKAIFHMHRWLEVSCDSAHSTLLIGIGRANCCDRSASRRIKRATAEGIEQAFARMQRQDASAVMIAADSFFVEQRERIAQLALKHRLPSIFSFREHVRAGGLISYGQHLADSYRRAATYVDRIFKGAKPGELPGRAVDQARAHRQSQDRQGPRPDRARYGSRPHRRDD
jgi:ABC transporter substrate binding protein